MVTAIPSNPENQEQLKNPEKSILWQQAWKKLSYRALGVAVGAEAFVAAASMDHLDEFEYQAAPLGAGLLACAYGVAAVVQRRRNEAAGLYDELVPEVDQPLAEIIPFELPVPDEMPTEPAAAVTYIYVS